MLTVSVVADARFNFAMQQNRVPLVKRVSVRNDGPTALKRATIRISADPPFFEPLTIEAQDIQPGEDRVTWAPPLIASASYLGELRERIEGTIQVDVFVEGEVAAAKRLPVSVLAYDEWGGLASSPELIAAFVLPNHPTVAAWLRAAAEFLGKWSSNPGLTGYQSGDRKRAKLTAAAIHEALRTLGATYASPPASFEVQGQKIRTPDRLAEERLGTCLDLAVAAAAALEQSGLHPLLIFVEGHAFVGVWLDEDQFAQPLVNDAAALEKRVALGEIEVFDPTPAASGADGSFDAAVAAARERLVDAPRFRCAVDVRRARLGGVRPLALRGAGVPADEAAKPAATIGQAPTIDLPAPAATPSVPETPAGRLEKWKLRLLDLTQRNRLLNFNDKIKKTVKLSVCGLGPLEDALADGNALRLRGRFAEKNRADAGGRDASPVALNELLREELGAGKIVADHDEDDLALRLTEIFRAARVAREEGGASGLYLALGFLEWFESPSSSLPRRAPLVLLPVELERRTITGGFKLTLGSEEPRFNSTLVEKLKADFGLQFTGFDPLPADESGIDIDGVLQRVREMVKEVARWRVHDSAALGFFTFAKFVMWQDLNANAAYLMGNKVVAHLVNGERSAFDSGWAAPGAETLDERFPTDKLHCPLPADSSQIAAIVAAAEGRSFVLEGPPGTGKSQTIANLISHCLELGKTVLFVSEKTAALEVVHRRLKAIGLDRHCLELHSNKAVKADVIRALGESLIDESRTVPADWAMTALETDRARSDLNAYVRETHRRYPNGLSIFEATSRLTGLRDAKRLELGWSDLSETPRERLAEAREALREASDLLGQLDPLVGHALEDVELVDGFGAVKERAFRACRRLRTALDAANRDVRPIAGALGVDIESASARGLAFVEHLCEIALDTPAEGFPLIASDVDEFEAEARLVTKLGRWRDEERRKLALRVSDGIFTIDLKGLQTEVAETERRWFVGRWLGMRACRRRLAPIWRGPKAPSLKEIRDYAVRAEAILARERELVDALGRFGRRTGIRYLVEGPTWSRIEAAARSASAAKARISAKAEDPGRAADAAKRLVAACGGGGPDNEARARFAACRAAVAELRDAVLESAESLKLSARHPWRDQSAPGYHRGLDERLRSFERGLPKLHVWAMWRRQRAKLLELALQGAVDAVERGEMRGAELGPAFERAFHENWLASVRERVPCLRDFFALTHTRRIERFRELDKKCAAMANVVAGARIAQRQRGSDESHAASKEASILTRQVGLKRNHMALRKLFEQTRSLTRRLKPCFLMSPISVAQHLAPGSIPFDLVVFDEASQIPTWDAIGALARGTQSVIVGDSKQLPPTSFFEAAIDGGEPVDEDDENAAPEDLDSILDECRVSGIPAMDLRWHYRSRDESLIAFSNRKYYENRLFTFPAATREGQGVVWKHVPHGVYDRGGSRTNAAEAQALVREVVRRLRSPNAGSESLGVVTFSQAQQKAVEDLLDAERMKDPDLDRFFVASADVPEPVFVKNLENVQGDERDVVLFSICYGPDQQGRTAMAFGPVNRKGGERRLNVAVTRARRTLLVFSTLTADHIDLGRTKARGAADLKLFLAYAQKGIDALPKEIRAPADGDDFDSPLEREICEALRALGHDVRTQVGCSGYKIDLAVVDPKWPGRYMLGIECDGANYHSAKTARDRDILRQSVLEGLGWRLLRVWSTDWWEERGVQLDRITGEIAALSAQSSEGMTSDPAAEKSVTAEAPEPDVVPDFNAAFVDSPPVGGVLTGEREHFAAVASLTPSAGGANAGGTPYTPTILGKLGTQDDFYAELGMKAVVEALHRVVAAEGPITVGFAAKRVCRAFGFERVKEAAALRVNEAAEHSGLVRTGQTPVSTVLWPTHLSPHTWRGFRTSRVGDEDVRKANDIPVQEVANAAEAHLARNGVCDRRSLYRALTRVFGFTQLGANLEAAMRAGVENLLAEGRAVAGPDDSIRLR